MVAVVLVGLGYHRRNTLFVYGCREATFPNGKNEVFNPNCPLSLGVEHPPPPTHPIIILSTRFFKLAKTKQILLQLTKLLKDLIAIIVPAQSYVLKSPWKFHPLNQ